MEQKNIFVTRLIPDTGLKMLIDKGYKVDVSGKDGVLTKEELKTALAKEKYDAVLCLLTDKIDDEIFEVAGARVKIFANYAVGFDNIDLAAAAKRGIYITNTPDVLTESVAEHAFAMMLALGRRIVEADEYMKHSDAFRGWEPMLLLGSDIIKKTLGIVGLGRIGTRLAMHARGFEMEILYTDPKPNADFEKEFGARFVDLSTLLKESDFVSIHVPLLPSTRHLIGEKELKMMKPSGYLINTSRGPVVDEHALADAIENKVIAGAALDVFEFEPKPVPALKAFSNVILTPHIASATIETRLKMSEVAAANIIAALEGNVPPNAVKPQK